MEGMINAESRVLKRDLLRVERWIADHPRFYFLRPMFEEVVGRPAQGIGEFAKRLPKLRQALQDEIRKKTQERKSR